MMYTIYIIRSYRNYVNCVYTLVCIYVYNICTGANSLLKVSAPQYVVL